MSEKAAATPATSREGVAEAAAEGGADVPLVQAEDLVCSWRKIAALKAPAPSSSDRAERAAAAAAVAFKGAFSGKFSL